MLNVHLSKQFLLEAFGKWFDVHIVAIASSFATSINILFAFCVHEICHWRKLSLYFLLIKKSAIYILLSILRIIVFTVFHINIPYYVLSQIVDNNHILNLSIFHHLLENLLIKIFIFGHCFICIFPCHIMAFNKRSLDCIIFIHML